jgi:hypothetical protein
VSRPPDAACVTAAAFSEGPYDTDTGYIVTCPREIRTPLLSSVVCQMRPMTATESDEWNIGG